MLKRIGIALMGLLVVAGVVRATETENLNLQILPVPKKVVVDGKVEDWDLTGGIFACGDVENGRDRYGVWLHAMYDAENIYVLARWVDPTPMNNPGSIKGDYGFRGDCLQVRFVTAPDIDSNDVLKRGQKDNDAEKVRTSHWDCWIDRDGLDKMNGSYGRRFNEGSANAKELGGEQAFQKWADGQGYNQEMKIPWKAITKDGIQPKTGDRILMTMEPNFTLSNVGRLTIKDLFRAGAPIDRIFTFRAYNCWGMGVLEKEGNVAVRPVRLADGREFPVKLDKSLPGAPSCGIPVVDWTGVVRVREFIGFKPIKFTMPEDGYVSLNIYAPDGTVARQLLASDFLTKGDHEIQWDGLSTYSWRLPGKVMEPGTYTWKAIYHKGLGLKLKGWACNGAAAPWTSTPTLDAWGGDHGDPVSCASDSNQVYLGWSGAEGSKALVACDLEGNTKWRNNRGGIASASLIAADGGNVYAMNVVGQYAPVGVYRLDSKIGGYQDWTELKSADLLMKNIWPDMTNAPSQPNALTAKDGKVFMSFGSLDTVVVVDGNTGAVLKKLDVPRPGDMEAASGDRLYMLSKGEIVAVDVPTGKIKSIVKPDCGDTNAWISSLALDKDGNLYAGIFKGPHQVQVYSPDGKLLRTIGRKGGRPLLGPWVRDGMLNISGLTIDGAGKLWVAENDGSPRRVSVWNAATGEFIKEFFGASSYGATGSAISPRDPSIMVGQGCEWKLDPKTGRGECLGTITRSNMGNARFGVGSNKRLYLAVSVFRSAATVEIFERMGDGQYKLRSALYPKKKDAPLKVWADVNDDGEEQAEEVKEYSDVELGGWISGWCMSMAPDMTFYGGKMQIKVTGFTKCGAPEYDLSKAIAMPAPEDMRGRGGMGAEKSMGSADGRLILYNGGYGADHSTVDCYDIASGKLVWKYPSNFTGVHGSHRAPGPEIALIRGAFDIAGSAKLPKPVGNIFVIPTNKGEWHVLTEDGYYLTKLFQGDPTKMMYPEKAEPGAILDNCPPGAGEEAFGGSFTYADDGHLYMQVGHTAFWNVEVTGIENIKELSSGGSIKLSEDDVAKAMEFREKALQGASGLRRFGAPKKTVTFTGDRGKDFGRGASLAFKKIENAEVKVSMTWDAETLYVGWEVQDDTPWVNGADAPEYMYARGDTVDLQLATRKDAKKDRQDGEEGDLRISIGPFQGQTTAMIYRKVAKEKKAKTFNSGVIKGYVMDSVVADKDIRTDVKIGKDKKSYTVFAAIPLSKLGITPEVGLSIRGDVGATHGSKEGNDTVLRTHWSNQETGLVSDEVFELKMVPRNWGEIVFEKGE